MKLIEAIIIFGAISSGMLALLALGFTLIYGVAEVVNMAHGALFMLGAYFFWLLTASFGLPFEPIQADPILAMVVSIVFVAIVGTIFYRVTIHPVLEDQTAVLVVTVGASIIIQQLMIVEFGAGRRPVTSFMSGYQTILGEKVTNSQLIAFAVSLVIFVFLWTFITKTKMGSSMRAVAQDREMGMLVGINTPRLHMLTMGISSLMAALAGILITASTTGMAYPHMWNEPLYMSFAIVILGGLGSVKGTLVGAFIIGFTENIFVFLVPGGSFLKGAVALAIMVLVIFFRPKGLFGKRIELEE